MKDRNVSMDRRARDGDEALDPGTCSRCRSTHPRSRSSPASSRALHCPRPRASKEPMLGRPYSFVNPPHAPPHEFYFNVVAGRAVLAAARERWQPGDPLWLRPRANGFFSRRRDAAGRRAVVHCRPAPASARSCRSCAPTSHGRSSRASCSSTRCALAERAHLSRRDRGDSCARTAARSAYVPIVSREAHPGRAARAHPGAIADGRLEARAGVPLTAENSHTMLCGNPAMVDDVQAVLATRGMRRHRRKEPGQSRSKPIGRVVGAAYRARRRTNAVRHR